MILEDYHLHTTFCDGKNSPEQMVKAAIEKIIDNIANKKALLVTQRCFFYLNSLFNC